MSPPLWVTDRPAPPSAVIERFERDGWRLDAGFALPESPWDLGELRLVRHGTIGDDDTMAAAVLAAARGVGLLLGCPDDDRRSRLVDDLTRIGDVETVSLGPDPLAALDDDQRALLSALAAGSSIAAAARELYLSPRTAERRLAAARASLGVRTTAEAIALAAS